METRSVCPLRSRGSRGFTLVEVLVALMVMAVLATMAWQGVDGIVRSREISETRLDDTLRLQTVLAQWEQDLASIQESPAVPALSFDGATLRLTRSTESGLQLVAWSLRPSATPGQQDLLRWAGRPTVNVKDLQDAWLQSQQFQGTETGQLRALRGLAQWQVYFHRGGGWSNAQSSGDVSQGAPGSPASQASPGTTGIPTRSEELPSGVRLVATFAPDGPLRGSLTRDIALGPLWRP